MGLRICKGKYLITNKNNIDFDFFQDSNNKFIFITNNGDIKSYITSDYKEHNEFLKVDDIYKNGHTLLAKTKLEYVPIIDNNKIIGFCYDDEYINDVIDKIKDLITFADGNILSAYSKAIIYGYNEIALYLEQLFKKCDLKYEIKKGLSTNYKSENKVDILELYVEGNTGLAIENYSYWKVNLEWLFDNMKIIYELYEILNKFDYNSETLIEQKIKNNKPFMMARVGNTELWIIKEYLHKKRNLITDYNPFWTNYLLSTSGFFTKNNIKNDIDKFAIKHIDAIRNCDFNLCYGNDELAVGLKITLDNLQKQSYNYDWNSLTIPFNNSWFKLLDGKKILVISPYSKSIKKQYNKIRKIYCDDYPKFELITYQSYETQLGNALGYSSYFEVLDKMEKDIRKIDFDIALICCGAYGYILSSHIKNMGKSAIELCSYLPNWFGIKIKRYCTKLDVNKHWNKDWIFPVENPIKKSDEIEESCYWE